MTEKNIKARIQLKNDTEENWNKAINFKPKKGEMIIYTVNNGIYPRLKVGDGTALLRNLPFVNEQSDWTTTDINKSSYIKNKPTLGTAAATNITDYATAAQGVRADAAMPKTGGTFAGDVILNNDPTSDLMAATKQYVDNNVRISETLNLGTQIGVLTINGVDTPIYTPNAAPMTVQVNPASNTPTAEFIISTNISSNEELTGVLGSTTILSDGKIIYYMTKYTLNENTCSSIRLQYSNTANDTGSIPIYSYGNKINRTLYPAGYILTLVYYQNAFYIASSNLGVVG